MAPHSLSPAWVRLDYHSIYGSHVQLITTVAWIPTSVTGTMGSYLAWSGSPVDAEVMIDAMVDKLADLHVVSTSFDLATIYTQATPTSPSFIQRQKSLAVPGTAGAVGPAMAIQSTLNMRTTLAGPFKLDLLDASALNLQMTKIRSLGFPPAVNALVAEATAFSNGWAGRDDSRPNIALSWTMTENNALRRRYKKG